MAVDVTIEGAEKLQALAKALKQVGDKELRKELFSSLQRATKPTREKVRANLAADLPHAGGLAAIMAASRLSTRTRAAGKNPAVRIEAKAPHDLRSMDKGRIRHPVYGNRKKWATQQIEPGVFSKPIEEDAPQIRDEILSGMESVALRFLDKH